MTRTISAKRNTLRVTALAGAILSVTVSMATAQSSTAQPADRVFLGKNILTMDAANPQADAVAVRNGLIVFVGSEADSKRYIAPSTQVTELGDRALLPGFIDAHSHISGVAHNVDNLNLASPPVGTVNSVDDIVSKIKNHIKDNNIQPGEWVIGYGYDDSLLQGKAHPTNADLDKASTENPIFLSHVSGHLGTTNSLALKLSGVTKDTPNPQGGVIRRWPDTQEPNGVLEESAALHILMTLGKQDDEQKIQSRLAKAVDYYTSFGITTIQDGAARPADVAALRNLADSGNLKVDIAADVGRFFLKDDAEAAAYAPEKDYKNNFRIAGFKYFLDGSPQGRTAWLTEPYHHGPEGAKSDYVAYPTSDVALYKKQACDAMNEGIQTNSHANGDAAIDLVLDSIEECFKGKAIPDHRSVIIHAQLMRKDQVERANALRAIPSFFSAHTFYWGDWHRQSFGEERAAHISPAKNALALHIPFTMHNDSPVVPPNMMLLVSSAVNRTTRSGFVLGEDEKIPVMDALKAITANAAYQYYEEDKKGSITVGKQADLVVLEKNPMSVPTSTLKDILVMETISHGASVYKR